MVVHDTWYLFSHSFDRLKRSLDIKLYANLKYIRAFPLCDSGYVADLDL